MRLLLSSIVALACCAPAQARSLAVRVVDGAGRPVTNAVVSVMLPGAPRAKPGNVYMVSQKDLQFRPYVLVVPTGARVSFPNNDQTRHHVYSFSPAKRFELKLFAQDQTRAVTFDRAGVVALGCNIHDQMSAFVYVSDSSWTARTDARGQASFADLPTAGGKVQVWHPWLRGPGNAAALPLSTTQAALTARVRLRAPPVHTAEGY